MSDVNKKASEGLFTVISLFAGCGGSSIGYKLSGGRVLCVNEFIPAAYETYGANFPETPIAKEDIRKLKGEDFLKIGELNIGELDILDGSPPCASFSTAGKTDKLWGQIKKYSDTKQRTDDLFFEFTRICNEIMPKVFVTENVKGLTKGIAKKFFIEEILPKMSEHYNVYCGVLSASNFGVPQKRERFICVGVRKDIKKTFAFPSGDIDSVSVQDAIENIVQNEEQRAFLLERGGYYANSRKWDEIPSEGMHHKIRFNVSKNNWSRPSFTLCAEDAHLNAAGLMHPFERRRHTIVEAKRLMAFPEDFILTGDFSKQYERLARAVPPLLHKAISNTIYEQILK